MPATDRNGTFVIRDSVSSAGSKVSESLKKAIAAKSTLNNSNYSYYGNLGDNFWKYYNPSLFMHISFRWNKRFGWRCNGLGLAQAPLLLPGKEWQTSLRTTRSVVLFDIGVAADSYGALFLYQSKCITYDNVWTSHDSLLLVSDPVLLLSPYIFIWNAWTYKIWHTVFRLNQVLCQIKSIRFGTSVEQHLNQAIVLQIV